MIEHREKIRGKAVLVTGGLGFVGQNLVKTLVRKYGCEVSLVDDLSNSTEAAIAEVRGEVKLIQDTVLNSSVLHPLIDGADYVFHLACKSISSSGIEPREHMRVNAESTLNMLEHIRHRRAERLQRFVFTGSTSVYGSTMTLPISEMQPTHLLSSYAATKLLGENYTLMYNWNYDLPTTAVRYSNVYGPGQSPTNPYCGVVGKFFHSALKGEPITIFGDGEQTRDYTYVDDAVDATILAAVHPRAYGDVFNVGTSVETSVNRVAELVMEHVAEVPVVNLPERDIDNIRRRAIDISKIHRTLGWTPRISIARGIGLTADWFRKRDL